MTAVDDQSRTFNAMRACQFKENPSSRDGLAWFREDVLSARGERAHCSCLARTRAHVRSWSVLSPGCDTVMERELPVRERRRRCKLWLGDRSGLTVMPNNY